ncbi:TonB-dependent receptor [Flavihumibacter sp. R14]|nr:TonB-dependent receptor [Flavihumibacter soli]
MIRRSFSRTVLISLFSFIPGICFGQSQVDSVQKLKEVVVRAYFSNQQILRLPASVAVIDYRQLRNQVGTSFVPAINTVPGIRMEERSPGSYRLSIRGSLLRSPFGIRNVKMYIDDFPLTDAGGNTYFNAIDAESVSGIEILKGPDGSLFGANSGGVVLINTFRPQDSSSIKAGLKGGSYNLVHENVNIRRNFRQHSFSLNQAFQRSEGYRNNSALKRHYGQVNYNWEYSKGNSLRLLALYSDLSYQTPGGLTVAQYNLDPQSARPATPMSPGAEEQHAGIFNKTLYGGVLNEWQIVKPLKHVVAVFGSHTDFKNPFITNYEVRDENTAGIRSYLEFIPVSATGFKWKGNVGLEWQRTSSDIQNYDNLAGQPGTIQSADELKADQHFFFSRFTGTFFDRIDLEIAASINYYQYQFPLNLIAAKAERKFEPQLMPRLALSWKVSENIAWRSSVSRGYSPPTISEIRASDQQINLALQPESGWNYETGIRLRNASDRFWLDASVFYYKLSDAITRRVNSDDTEYFLNAGGTRQLGFESQISAWLIPPSNHNFIKGLQLRNSITLNNFEFRNYINGTDNYSGKKLTGVPEQVIVSSTNILLPASIALFLQHNYTSKIPLNDSNSELSDNYNLVQLKISWNSMNRFKSNVELSAGVDNLLNEKYSLGNDLNAFGGRYYNAAPGRNYIIGVNARF